jgi:hypothetical protein
MLHNFPAYDDGNPLNMSAERRALVGQLRELLQTSGMDDFFFAVTALLSQAGIQRINQECAEVWAYNGCILCGIQVDHAPGECEHWELDGTQPTGFNSDDVDGQAILCKGKNGEQWVELHFVYLQDAQVVQLARLQLDYPAVVLVRPDLVSQPGAAVCVAIYKDENHWPGIRSDEAARQQRERDYQTQAHAARLRRLEEL